MKGETMSWVVVLAVVVGLVLGSVIAAVQVLGAEAPATAQTEPEPGCRAVEAWRDYRQAQWRVDDFVENPRDRFRGEPDETIADRVGWQDAMKELHKPRPTRTLRGEFHHWLKEWKGDEAGLRVSDATLRKEADRCDGLEGRR